jgi:hypothetical protein
MAYCGTDPIAIIVEAIPSVSVSLGAVMKITIAARRMLLVLIDLII